MSEKKEMQYDLQGSMVSPHSSPQRDCKEGRRGVTKLGRKGEEEQRRVLVSFSGGITGAALLKWLLARGYEVAAMISDLGQQEDLEEAKQLALRLGAYKVYVENLKEEFLTDFVVPTLMANAAYEGRDMLGTALSRFVIARRQCRIAERDAFTFVSHGCSGVGNDQCRFELTYAALYPQVKVISPFREPEFKRLAEAGREALIEYTGIDPAAQTEHSRDCNIYSSTQWGGALDEPQTAAAEHLWTTRDPTEVKHEPDKITVAFKDGRPSRVVNCTTDEVFDTVVSIFTALAELGSRHGIGRCDIVDNRFIGVKNRRILECPAGAILMAAHQDIEGIALDKEVMRIRDMFTPKFAELVYNGFWFSPEMDFIQAAVRKSQEVIDGTVTLRLHRGAAVPIARTSPTTAGNQSLPTPRDVEGYIKVTAARLGAHATIMDNLNRERLKSGSPGGHKTTNWRAAEGESSSYNQFWGQNRSFG